MGNHEVLYGLDDEWEYMRSADGLIQNPKQFMGEWDAIKEWNKPDIAEPLFLNTDSYKNFCEPESLILLGRTGTGKTAILCRLNQRVNDGKFDEYCKSIMISFDSVLIETKDLLNDYQNSVGLIEIENLLSVFFYVTVMEDVVKSNINDKERVKRIRAYLEKKNIFVDDRSTGTEGLIRHGLNAIKSVADREGKVASVAKELESVTTLISELKSNGYETAMEELREILSKDNYLILVDSSNEYDLKDVGIVRCTKALISVCFSFYNNVEQNHVYIKLSLPSEIYTMLVEELPGKQQENTVIIQWSQKELIRLAALRLYESSKSNKYGKKILQFDNKYSYELFYHETAGSYEHAMELVTSFLPKESITGIDLICDVDTYLIRHTLRKPRDIMVIFNFLLTKLYIEKDMYYFLKNPKELHNYIHSAQENMINSALSMYTNTYKKIADDCFVVLNGLDFIFDGKQLKDRLKATNSFKYSDLGESYKIDKEEIKRILLESGLVGTYEKEVLMYSSHINESEPKEPHNIRNSYRLVEALYEYQVKGRLRFSDDNYYVIHPMCYEHFGCRVRKQTLVFPNRIDSDARADLIIKNE